MNKIKKRHILYSEKVRFRKFELMKKAQKIYLNDKSSVNCDVLKWNSDEFFKYNNLHISKLNRYFYNVKD